MKKLLILLIMIFLISLGTAFAGDHPTAEHPSADHATMDHPTTNHPSMDTFRHKETVDGILADFQVMSLAGINMTDPEGNTHHIMVKFMHDKMDHQIMNVAGKIKIINPSGKEQVAKLKDFNGMYASNFIFDEKGRYGVICLFKENGNKHVAKFWYDHK
ncbi:MAG: hypothetical protein K9L30_02250 [Desulfobacterales bacterium]|nr:hypothetical protein [Desulfobacterales bacterium]